LFGLGTLLAGYAVTLHNMWLLWLGYGVIAGIGNGLGYVTPVAVLLRWFPDKKGVITGMAVMGFGLGAAGMGKLAPWINLHWGVSNTFFVCGAAFMIGILLAAQKLSNPPPGYSVAGKSGKPAAAPVDSMTLAQAAGKHQFYILWCLLLLNVIAGIAIISNLSPMAEELLGMKRGNRNIKLLPQDVQNSILLMAGSIVFATQIFNGLGRMFWGSLSEKIGRRGVFLLLFATQVPLFFLLPHVTSVWLFAIIACWILLCYGGGFGTMPSFAADTFGPKNIGAIYGVILFAWGVAGGVGPTLMEGVKSATKTAQNPNGSFDVALQIAGGLLVLGLLLALLYRKPKLQAPA
jgi:OFA family oxalate/formate antiporter-like MFS transporter